ncbi:hypothetical protein BOX15_Mlig028955g2 [Macrostomum lignano]|uniref:Serpin domain-containing protein n=1 Tax=Macrostomum lignano TaxID=282301 RepID=A0A267GIZ5_9PLAT|nr:hypothetical protein BOX15_Mlig028955g2 [Macrostomum lignano]
MDPLNAHNAFALDLYRAISEANTGRNFLLSPISIFATLSMILPGARKQTLDQLVSGMRLSEPGQKPLSAESLAQLESSLGRMLSSAIPAGNAASSSKLSSSLQSANRAFIQAGMEVRPDFLTALRSSFKSEILSAEFAKDPEAERVRINNWVATVTKDKIPELLKSGSVDPLTRLVLVNALYFIANWSVPFDPRSTFDEPFELNASTAPVSVPMMHRTANWPIVFVADVLTGVRFDFEDDNSGQRMSLLAVLPAERHGLDGLLAKMSQEDWLRLVNDAGESGKAAVSLPKIKLNSFTELSEAAYLPHLGFGKLFSNDADLSGIASTPGDLYVSSFAHQAALEWDEFGAEGAAASAAAINTRMAPPRIAFDQPFAVIVSREVATSGDGAGDKRQVPIFIGRVSDPRG